MYVCASGGKSQNLECFVFLKHPFWDSPRAPPNIISEMPLQHTSKIHLLTNNNLLILKFKFIFRKSILIFLKMKNLKECK